MRAGLTQFGSDSQFGLERPTAWSPALTPLASKTQLMMLYFPLKIQSQRIARATAGTRFGRK